MSIKLCEVSEMDGLFITVVGFRNTVPSVGAVLTCVKEPFNRVDDDAIRVLDEAGETVGYIANQGSTKAGGTLSASRIYDRVGDAFRVEVCFTTRTKLICRVTETDVE